MGAESIEGRIRELYRGSLDAFIASRDALVRELRDAADASGAARVKRLRKPTVPAWAVDQLSDRDPSAVESLLEAGAEVRAAQQATLSSSKAADRLREATAARRRIVAALVRTATSVLADAGISPGAHLEDVRTTLEQASVDAELGEQLRSGTLERPAPPAAGLGEGFGLHLVTDGDVDVEDGEAIDGGAKPEARSEKVRERERPALRREAAKALEMAKRARATADRLASDVDRVRVRLEELTEKHARAEREALEAELRARRAADGVDAHDGEG
jgi:hypothetical protein